VHDHSELTSLYTVPLSTVNGLNHLTMMSNGQARCWRQKVDFNFDASVDRTLEEI